MGETVMITMAIDCVWSFREVEGVAEEEEEVEVVVEAEAWGRQGIGTALHPDAPKTEWLCQVSNAFLFSVPLPQEKPYFVHHLLSSCFLSGLPQSGSWQDLKDHMREAGDVCYADVFRDGTGVVEFVRKEDMTYAVRKLDNTKFRSHEVRNESEQKALLLRRCS